MTQEEKNEVFGCDAQEETAAQAQEDSERIQREIEEERGDQII